MEFIPLPSDPSILTNSKVIKTRLTLVVYVDDLLIVEEYKKNIINVKQLFRVQFEVKNLGEV